MSQDTHIWAKLVAVNPNNETILLKTQIGGRDEDSSDNMWRIYQSPTGGVWIKNLSSSLMRVGDSWLEVNQEKEITNGETLLFNQDVGNPDRNFDYVFCLTDWQSESRQGRRREENFDSTTTFLSPETQKKMKVGDILEKEFQCIFCLSIKQNCATLSPCQHSFCSLCLLNNIKKSAKPTECPICRDAFQSIGKYFALRNPQEVTEIFTNTQTQKEQRKIQLEGNIYPQDGGFFIGSRLNGKNDGKGHKIFSNGKIFEGTWRNGSREGEGALIFENGRIYLGVWKDDLLARMIDEIILPDLGFYKGGTNDFKRHGKGTLKYDNGDVFKGEWKEDQIDGAGILIRSNGDQYQGTWKDNIIEPLVEIKYANGDIYKGEINVDNWQRQGKGILKFSNGDEYDGMWCNDKQHGKGKESLRGGSRIFEGVWVEGSMIRDITMTDVEGARYRVELMRLSE